MISQDDGVCSFIVHQELISYFYRSSPFKAIALKDE